MDRILTVAHPRIYVVTPVTCNENTGFIFKMACDFNIKAIENKGCKVYGTEIEAKNYLSERLELLQPPNDWLYEFFEETTPSIVLSGNRYKIVGDHCLITNHDIPVEKDIERPESHDPNQGIGIEDFLVQFRI